MENIYFKGLNKALDKGCYIKVFTCTLKHPIVRIEKIDKKTKEEKIIVESENGNVLSALNSASDKVVKETSNKKDIILCDRCNLDNVIENGYTLQFYKLSNEKVLSSICTYSLNFPNKRTEKSSYIVNDNEYLKTNYTVNMNKQTYYPIISVITDNVEEGFELLNYYLENINYKEIKESIIDNNILKRKSN